MASKAKRTINPMTDKQFLNFGGNRCPYCESTDLENASLPEIKTGACYQRVECYTCGCFWDEIYRMFGWVEVDEQI